MPKTPTKKLTKREVAENQRKLLVAASLDKISKKLKADAGDCDPEPGGYPITFQLTVDDSTVSVGGPKTLPRGYKWSKLDLMNAVLFGCEEFEELIEMGFQLLVEAEHDADLASELKAFSSTVTDHYEGQHDRRRRRTAPRVTRGAKTATVAGLVLEGSVGPERFDISVEETC